MKYKNRYKIAIGFGIGIAVTYILQNALLKEIYASKEIAKSFISGIVGGAVVGIIIWCISGLKNKTKNGEDTIVR